MSHRRNLPGPGPAADPGRVRAGRPAAPTATPVSPVTPTSTVAPPPTASPAPTATATPRPQPGLLVDDTFTPAEQAALQARLDDPPAEWGYDPATTDL